MLKKRQKQNIIEEHKTHGTDTGSAEVQIGLLSKSIIELTKHLKQHPKDRHSRRGLLMMVGKRRRLLSYLMRNKSKRYATLVKKLGLKE